MSERIAEMDIRPWPYELPSADGKWWVAEEDDAVGWAIWVHVLTPTRRHGCRRVGLNEDRMKVRLELVQALDRSEP